MREPPRPPSLEEFLQVAREAFAFLLPYGFSEVSPPPHRSGNRFELWYRAADRVVVVMGEGYGMFARVMLECGEFEMSPFFLVPPEERPPRPRKRAPQPSQLEQLRSEATRLEKYGGDFLAGDLRRFQALAEPLPPYKRPRS